ncbi:putative WW domain-containing oxidoreductase [Halenospora varia]|nr:putative WW domain-containing oxidoreductase [Halenospora varia]
MPSSRYAQVHLNPEGPGDARPTALQIIKDEGLTGALSNKTILITGCSSGIGIETARALSSTGATLFLTARDIPKAEKALEGVLELGRVELLEMNLSSLDSVRKAATEFRERNAKLGNRLNILICNAGIMAVPSLEKTKDGFESQFGVNHLSHFLLFNLLKDLLLSSTAPDFNSRVVMVSSSGHRGGGILVGDYGFQKEEYGPGKAYGQSKTANIYMANEIERRYGPQGLHANSLMPGGIKTGLQEYIPAEVQKGWWKWKGVKSTEQGAATTVLAAIGKEYEGVGGRYLEDCGEPGAFEEGNPPSAPGYEKWTFDEKLEVQLWRDSLVMVGLDKQHAG